MKKIVILSLVITMAFSLCVNAEEGANMGTATIGTDAEILGANLVLNGDFESGTEEWKNWVGNYASASETAYSGSKSIKLWADTSGANEQLIQNIKVKPSTTYDFSAYMRVPSGQSAKISLLLAADGYTQETVATMWASYNADNKDNNFLPNKVDGSTGDGHTVWKELSTTITIPEASNFPSYNEADESTYPNICIYIQYTSGGNWNRYLYIDDVALQQVFTKDEIIKGASFYQNDEDITDSGFTTGVIVAKVNMENVTVDGRNPYVVVAVYSGNKMLAYSYGSVKDYEEDGTITVSANISVTEEMIDEGCSILAFVWADLNTMISISETYGLGTI